MCTAAVVSTKVSFSAVSEKMSKLAVVLAESTGVFVFEEFTGADVSARSSAAVCWQSQEVQ